MEKEFPIIKNTNKIITEPNNGKSHQDFYANNITNTKKRHDEF